MGRTVTHLITGLGKGGAETMLYQVLKYRTDQEITHQVISLGRSDYYGEPIRELGISVTELAFQAHPISGFFRLVRLLRGTNTLCCWMYHANFIGYLAARFIGITRVIWCIHHADLNPKHNKKSTLIINQICAHWSPHIHTITYTGELARSIHEGTGYCRSNGLVLHNGCDIAEYVPNSQARESLCRELHIDAEKQIILSVTKNTPIKDIPTFLHAFGMMHRRQSTVVAVLCGGGVEPQSPQLAALCAQEGLKNGQDIFLLGMRHDIPRLLAACDLYVLHSAGEAFPITLLQAMSCGCLCIATDVGDAQRILDDAECIVPPGNADALAEKMESLLILDTEDAGRRRSRNQESAHERFDIRQIIREYESLF